MKSRQLSAAKRNQAIFILNELTKKLPDHILQKYCADLAPGNVRMILQEIIDIIGPGTQDYKPSSQAAASVKYWPENGKDWKGKLKGKTLHLYTDGASRGNPGEAGAGITILDEQGNELTATEKYLGRCTNNEAEYRALLLGLAKCGEFGKGRIKAHLDSELVVKQILGQYRVKHPNLKPLFREAMHKLSGFAAYSVVHVRREKNSRADELANQAIDNHMQ